MGVIKILCGLPACGKTFFANSKKDVNTIVVDCDDMFRERKDLKKEAIYHRIANQLYGKYKNKKIILDGLFLTVNDVSEIVTYLHDAFKNDFTFEVEYWPADRETCLKNDNGRRPVDSRQTIKKGVLDEMTEEILLKATGLKIPVNIHKTVLKAEYKTMIDDMKEFSRSIEDERYLYSSEWYVSAEYPDKVFISKDDKAISDFEELDEILEKYFPNITYLQYKRLKRECVDVYDFDTNDYYTGTIYWAKYRCDLEKLYKFIKERSDTNGLPSFAD